MIGQSSKVIWAPKPSSRRALTGVSPQVFDLRGRKKQVLIE
jgi:hypothetical protein